MQNGKLLLYLLQEESYGGTGRTASRKYGQPKYCSTRPNKNALALTVSQAEEEPFLIIVRETEPSPPFIHAFKVQGDRWHRMLFMTLAWNIAADF
ncbi:hypothetical protein DEO72_LG6g2391 [Vigna unguiculata]|uniref:Uncharacterized protein n=1 Tax=Vigna unguiculata TaxID=3917 RepID=A0A4D6MAA7_VIGUN|nr:hypothetical protein DEO72_LG6g2391 [Vigna unguiculata]